MNFINSPIDFFEYQGRTLFVKRDDLLNQQFNGNKARKLFYYLNNDFPEIDTLISYGGNQSNLMYSLSCLAQLKSWSFTYYTPKVSTQALNMDEGNLSMSLKNGMNLVPIEKHFNAFAQNLINDVVSNQLLISQGASQQQAEEGIKQLADEINAWASNKGFSRLAIIIPSGTGTSAAYLQKNLPEHNVYTTNCIGNTEFFNLQIQNLVADKQFPKLLVNKKFRFATPNQELFTTITKISQASNIEFDLIYDPVMWHLLLENLDQIPEPILYIHCGGINGNSTMLKRYKYLLSQKYPKNHIG